MVFFYLVGHLLGEIISKELTIDDFEVYLEKFPQDLKIQYNEKLVFLVNFFGEECGILLDSKLQLTRQR
jgi:hypothetical protein